MESKHKYIPGTNSYKSIYVPLDIYDYLKRISTFRDERMCHTIKHALTILEELDSDKSTNYSLLKDILADYAKSFNNLKNELMELKNSIHSLMDVVADILKKSNNH